MFFKIYSHSPGGPSGWYIIDSSNIESVSALIDPSELQEEGFKILINVSTDCSCLIIHSIDEDSHDGKILQLINILGIRQYEII